jgi:hypothetical protein
MGGHRVIAPVRFVVIHERRALVSDFEERGNHYLQRKTISHSTGTVEYWEVGDIIRVGGVERYRASSDFAGKTREEAIQWIERQR